MRDPETCELATAAATHHAGQPDVVVNAVGVAAFGPVEEVSVELMEELFMTSTFVPNSVAKAALTAMSEDGAIVNISATIAEQALLGMAGCAASRATVRSFDEALTREARRRRIRVIDARPPHTDTGLASRPIVATSR